MKVGIKAAAALSVVSLALLAGCSNSTTASSSTSSSAAGAAISVTFLPKNLGLSLIHI